MPELTFEYQSIETAPKDRTLMLWCPKRMVWLKGKWDIQPYHKNPKPCWRTHGSLGVSYDRDDQPTLWADLYDMIPEASHV